MKKINLKGKFELFSEQWTPKAIASLNDYQLKIARIQGDFPFHRHQDTDEMFLLIEGRMRMDFENGSEELEAGELIVVPKGALHRPHADEEAKILMIEPAGTLNTGDVEDEHTQREIETL